MAKKPLRPSLSLGHLPCEGRLSRGHSPRQTVKKDAFTPWPPLRGGSARRRWGRELYGCPKYFGLWQGSLPPPLRGTVPPLAQAPPPPYRGSLSRRGRFFDTMRLPQKGKPFRYACSCTYRMNASRSAVERTTAVYIQSPMSRRSAWGMRSHIRIREPYLAMICAWVCLYSWQSRRPA